MIVAGAGMAGLCAAARARELGVSPTVLEKGDRPGGSMLLSSGVVWQYRSLEDFLVRCAQRGDDLQASDRLVTSIQLLKHRCREQMKAAITVVARVLSPLTALLDKVVIAAPLAAEQFQIQSAPSQFIGLQLDEPFGQGKPLIETSIDQQRFRLGG